MNIQIIIDMLTAERDRMNAAIESLSEGDMKPAKKSPTLFRETDLPAEHQRPPRKMSIEGRKAIGDAARKRWARIKAGKADSPFKAHRKRATK